MKSRSNRSRWRHKSVRRLIVCHGGGDPVDIIRERAVAVVNTAKAQGWSGPPFNPMILASIRGIKVRESKHLFSAEAQLTPIDGDQLLLEFNPERPSGRKNYSISHEIGHTLFDDCCETTHQRKSDPKAFDPEEEVEQLCQIAAAEILMPEPEFRKDLKRLGFTLESVEELKTLYEASPEAVMRRMIDLSDETAALAFFSSRLKPVEERQVAEGGSINGFVPKLRILYSRPSPDFPIYLPAHKSAPDGSCVCRADESYQIHSATEEWPIRGFGNWRIEAMSLPVSENAGADSPSVVALILPS